MVNSRKNSLHPSYDLILEDGTYLVNVQMVPETEYLVTEADNPIIHRLPLWFWGRVPGLGKVVRNMWAKSRGGRLASIPPTQF